jgi:hypothetical protein
MNPETKPVSPRLQRIQLVSRIVRYAILGCLILAVVPFLFIFFWWTPPPSWSISHLLHPLLMIPTQAVLCLWYWKLAKLFHFYERGLIFAAETIRCIQTLGILCVINWLLLSAYNVLGRIFPPPPPPALPPHVTVTAVESPFRIGFFTFSIAGFNLGLLLAGIIIVLIAWIMDEGRKIQEEQELTV